MTICRGIQVAGESAALLTCTACFRQRGRPFDLSIWCVWLALALHKHKKITKMKLINAHDGYQYHLHLFLMKFYLQSVRMDRTTVALRDLNGRLMSYWTRNHAWCLAFDAANKIAAVAVAIVPHSPRSTRGRIARKKVTTSPREWTFSRVAVLVHHLFLLNYVDLSVPASIISPRRTSLGLSNRTMLDKIAETSNLITQAMDAMVITQAMAS